MKNEHTTGKEIKSKSHKTKIINLSGEMTKDKISM